MKELHSEIEIDASAERVWRLLTDFASYPEWNPFIRSISGQPTPGERLEVRIEPPGGRGMTFRPTVLTAEDNRELRWLGHLLVPGLFDGEHSLTIQPLGENRARFVQREAFKGLLVPLFTAPCSEVAPLRIVGTQCLLGRPARVDIRDRHERTMPKSEAACGAMSSQGAVRRSLDNNTQRGFEEMNRALKERAEVSPTGH